MRGRPRRWCRAPVAPPRRRTRGTLPRGDRAARSSRHVPPASRARTRGWSRASSNRVSPWRSSPIRRRLCSARRSRPPNTSSGASSPGIPHTDSAVSIGPPPANTPSRANRRWSSGSSRSWLQSMAPRSVRWRSGRSRPPDDSRPSRSPSRCAIAAGESSRIRAAASSIASGRPSSRRTTSATWAPFSGVSVKSGRTAIARSTNRRTASAAMRVADVGRARRWQGQRRDRKLLLAGDPQRGPARDDDRQPGRRAQQVGDDRGTRDHLLEVVEHEQGRPLPEVLLHPLDGRALRGEQADRGRDRRGDELGVGDRGQRHEPRAVRKALDAVARQRQREPRLAGAAGAREREQARPDEERHGVVHLGAADERGQLRRQVVGREIEGLERGKRGPEPVGDHLVQALRAREVLQLVLADVVQGDRAIRLARDRARRIRDDDLAAVRRRGDARGAMHLDARRSRPRRPAPRPCGCPSGPGHRRRPRRGRRGRAAPQRRPEAPPRPTRTPRTPRRPRTRTRRRPARRRLARRWPCGSRGSRRTPRRRPRGAAGSSLRCR